MLQHLSFFKHERMQRNSEMKDLNDMTLSLDVGFSSGFIPEDVMIQCLVRLPVKSSIRFMAVCKSWKNFISSPGFAEMHFRHSKFNEQLLRVGLNPQGYFPEISLLKLLGTKDAKSGVWSGNISLPFRSQPFEEVVIEGSCNGLVVLRTKSIPSIVLCNPATRAFRHLSLPFNEVSSPVGFCFISETKDYKIVRIQTIHGQRLSSGTTIYPGWVYSLNSDSWKKLDVAFPYIKLQPGQSGMATIFNECMHWIADEGEGRIAAFDVKKKAFQYMSLPVPEGLLWGFASILAIIKGSLSVVMTIRTGICNMGFEVWKMNEYGVEGSWSKLFSIRESFRVVVQPVGSWKDRRILFKYTSGNDERVFSYDPSTRKIERFCMSGSINLQVINYVESMESVEGGLRRISQNRIMAKSTGPLSAVGCTSRGSDSGNFSTRVVISGGQDNKKEDDDSEGQRQKHDLRTLESSSNFEGENSRKGKRKLQ